MLRIKSEKFNKILCYKPGIYIDLATIRQVLHCVIIIITVLLYEAPSFC
jgi:hypothetical protein